MSKIRKTLAMLLALAIMIACLAGCGSSENEDQAASQESPASETAAEEEPAGEVLVLKYGHNKTHLSTPGPLNWQSWWTSTPTVP